MPVFPSSELCEVYNVKPSVATRQMMQSILKVCNLNVGSAHRLAVMSILQQNFISSFEFGSPQSGFKKCSVT